MGSLRRYKGLARALGSLGPARAWLQFLPGVGSKGGWSVDGGRAITAPWAHFSVEVGRPGHRELPRCCRSPRGASFQELSLHFPDSFLLSVQSHSVAIPF